MLVHDFLQVCTGKTKLYKGQGSVCFYSERIFLTNEHHSFAFQLRLASTLMIKVRYFYFSKASSCREIKFVHSIKGKSIFYMYYLLRNLISGSKLIPSLDIFYNDTLPVEKFLVLIDVETGTTSEVRGF